MRESISLKIDLKFPPTSSKLDLNLILARLIQDAPPSYGIIFEAIYRQRRRRRHSLTTGKPTYNQVDTQPNSDERVFTTTLPLAHFNAFP
jgi:hypothetical protein